jgi:ribonuclease P protein component
VRAHGVRARTAHLEVRAIAARDASGRAGIIVPRYAHSAVDRNRLKRRLREVLRQHWIADFTACDLVLRALPGAYTLTWAQLARECETLRATARARVQTLTPTHLTTHSPTRTAGSVGEVLGELPGADRAPAR